MNKLALQRYFSLFFILISCIGYSQIKKYSISGYIKESGTNDFLYSTKFPYLLIEKGIILINGPLGKKIIIDDIEYVRTFYGDFIFHTKSKEITISTEHLESSSKKTLQLKLEELGVKLV